MKMHKVDRRDFLRKALHIGIGASLFPSIYKCPSTIRSDSKKKTLVLGLDGMDPNLVRRFVREGIMPNFSRLIRGGGFGEMRSSIPPQSPVAWSNFSVGASPKVHGIFDFIHRDPETMMPYLSTSNVRGAEKTFNIGDWKIPLEGGKARILREGTPFWEYLEENGIPAAIFKAPSNFPSVGAKTRQVSGMGTPDLLGSYGTFSLFTTNPPVNTEDITGGEIFPVVMRDNKIAASIKGPVNTLKKDEPHVKIPFAVWRDKTYDVVKLRLQGKEYILKKGEWTDWIRLSFEIIPHLYDVKGICKILIKRIHPHFEMYVSPINIDPSDQALPVTTPPDYGKELVKNVGYFYTQGLPDDTKALSYDILTEDEYLQLAYQILDERKELMEYELQRLKGMETGFLFFYFSSLDQNTHMYWRSIDPANPLYTKELCDKYGNVIKDLYKETDDILGEFYRRFDLNDENFRLFIMSDHGFAPFNRCVNLNAWLYKNGYISILKTSENAKSSIFENVDWFKTRAYGLGINSLYINKKGREKYGVVNSSKAENLMLELKEKFLNLIDHKTGERVISNVWLTKDLYKREDDKTPDMIIGWNRGYRASWDTILGDFSKEIIYDNTDKWSGDHCIDPKHVPAILISNKVITKRYPALVDVTATILSEYGIPLPGHMEGKPLYKL